MRTSVNPGLLHQGDVPADLAGGTIHRLVAGPDKELALARPLRMFGRALSQHNCGDQR